MKFYNIALIASAFALAACGGDKTPAADTSTAMGTGTMTDTAAMGAPMAGGPAMAMAPITGTTHEVKMIGDDKGYRFEPANLTVKAGDGVRFMMVSGGPHNAAFDAATVPAAGQAQLMANMPNQMAPLTGPLLINAGEAYTVSFANVAPGAYNYNCTPHVAMGMKGVITVQ